MANGTEVARLYARLEADVTSFDRGLSHMTRGLNVFEQAAIGAFRRVGEVAINTVGKAFEKVGDIAKAGIDFNAMQEQAEIAFTTMLGSAQEAQAFLEKMQAFARTTPFEYPDLLVASRRLMALGFTADEVLPMLTNIGNATAAMGGGQDMIDRVTTALGQMRAKGKVQAEEMMQLTENGIAAWDMLAKHLNVDVAKAMDMVTKRQVDAATGIEAIMNGISGRFGGMMEKQASTWQGLISNLKDSFGMLSGRVMKPFFDVVRQGLQWLTDLVSSDAFNKGIDRFVDRVTRGLSYLSNTMEWFRNTFSFQLTVLSSENSTFGERIVAVWDMIAQTGAKLFEGLVQSLRSLIPKWLENLGGLGGRLWEWIKEAIPKTLEWLGNWFNELARWVDESGPEWLKVLVDWGESLWRWIVDTIPIVIDKLGEWGGNIWEWLKTNGPIWMNTLAQWGEAALNFVRAVGDILKGVGTLVRPIVEAIANFISWKDVVIGAATALLVHFWPAIAAAGAAFGSFVAAWWPVAAVFVAATAASALLRNAWENDWLGVRTAIQSTWNLVASTFAPFGEKIAAFVRILVALWQQLDRENADLTTRLSVTWRELKAIAQIAWEGIVEVVRVLLTPFAEALRAWGEAAWQWFGENFPRTAATLVAAVQTIQDKWNQLWQVLGPIVAAIGGRIMELVTHWRNGTSEFGNVLNALKAVFDGAWGIIVRVVTLAISTMMDALKLVMQLLTGDWAGAWETAKGIVQNVFLGLTGIVFSAIETIMSALGLNSEVVKTWQINFVRAVNKVIEIIGKIAKPILDLIASFYSWKDVMVLIGTVIATALGAKLVGAIMAAVGAIGMFLATWGPVIALFTLMTTAIATLRHAWEENWGGIREKTFNAWEQIKYAIRTGVENITKWFKESSGLWKGNWDDTIDYLIWLATVGLRQTVYYAITDFFYDTKGQLITWALFFKNKSAEWKQDMIDTALSWKSTFTETFTRAKDIILGTFDKWTEPVRKQVETWAVNIRGKIGENGYWGWIKKYFGDARDWIIEKWNQIIEWWERNVQPWIDKAVNLGKNVVDGLKRGMEQAWNTLTTWWDGLWGPNKGLTKTVQVKMETHSPSKVMERLGSDVMEGFAIGAESMLPRVMGVMDNLSSSVNATMAGLSGTITSVASPYTTLANAVGGDKAQSIIDALHAFGAKATKAFEMGNVAAGNIAYYHAKNIMDTDAGLSIEVIRNRIDNLIAQLGAKGVGTTFGADAKEGLAALSEYLGVLVTGGTYNSGSLPETEPSAPGGDDSELLRAILAELQNGRKSTERGFDMLLEYLSRGAGGYGYGELVNLRNGLR